MYKNFTFESTQSRGNRILKALGDLTWGEMPDDGIFLKEIETPVVAAKEDAPPIEKPNIKSTLRQFWELREESCEDENSNLSKKVDEMEIERQMVVEHSAQEEPKNLEILYKKQTPVNYEYENSDFYAEPPQPVTERKNMKIVRRFENDQGQNYRVNSQSQLSQQNADYLNKLQKAMPEPKLIKGKTKHSQKYGYNPSSSTLFDHRKKKADMSNMTQMSQWNTINEDIDDDLEDTPEEEFYKRPGGKKLRLETDAGITRREEAHKIVYPMDGKDSLIKDKDNGSGKERGLQDILERAVRRASNQTITRWLIKVVSYKTSKGIHTVEFLCVSPQPDGSTTSYAVINVGKQYYGHNIVPEKRYYFVNPRPLIQQEINNKKVYYVDKIEEAVN